jgi:hypothetical protein
MFFGWLGSEAMVVTMADAGQDMAAVFAVDWGMTLGLLGALVLAALAAAVLPGNRAARATVVEALAVDGVW